MADKPIVYAIVSQCEFCGSMIGERKANFFRPETKRFQYFQVSLCRRCLNRGLEAIDKGIKT